ncbi:hypothetical protein Catovirus_1_492 [Catovirus CTV1]|uniref:Uncharacterized protein n=1 Tax=Catovirus CTV1 TaxID=1977631 RepID=A0A1V0S9Q9_9VIRU|nr:hypothetical protein Catovirus_1_492 [Catovirus CTV1]
MITFTEFQKISADEQSLAITICISKNNETLRLFYPIHYLMSMDKNQFLKTIQTSEYKETKLYTIYLLDEEDMLVAKSCLEDIYSYYSNSATYKPKYIQYFREYSRVLFLSRFSDLKLPKIYTVLVPLDKTLNELDKNHQIITDMLKKSKGSSSSLKSRMFLGYIPSSIIDNDGVLEQMFHTLLNSFKSYYEKNTTELAMLYCNILTRRNNDNLLKIINDVFGSIVVNFTNYSWVNISLDFLLHIDHIVFNDFCVKAEKDNNSIVISVSKNWGKSWTVSDTITNDQHQNIIYIDGTCVLV